MPRSYTAIEFTCVWSAITWSLVASVCKRFIDAGDVLGDRLHEFRELVDLVVDAVMRGRARLASAALCMSRYCMSVRPVIDAA